VTLAEAADTLNRYGRSRAQADVSSLQRRRRAGFPASSAVDHSRRGVKAASRTCERSPEDPRCTDRLDRSARSCHAGAAERPGWGLAARGRSRAHTKFRRSDCPRRARGRLASSLQGGWSMGGAGRRWDSQKATRATPWATWLRKDVCCGGDCSRAYGAPSGSSPRCCGLLVSGRDCGEPEAHLRIRVWWTVGRVFRRVRCARALARRSDRAWRDQADGERGTSDARCIQRSQSAGRRDQPRGCARQRRLATLRRSVRATKAERPPATSGSAEALGDATSQGHKHRWRGRQAQRTSTRCSGASRVGRGATGALGRAPGHHLCGHERCDRGCAPATLVRP
jgi:hypothetical protein